MSVGLHHEARACEFCDGVAGFDYFRSNTRTLCKANVFGCCTPCAMSSRARALLILIMRTHDDLKYTRTCDDARNRDGGRRKEEENVCAREGRREKERERRRNEWGKNTSLFSGGQAEGGFVCDRWYALHVELRVNESTRLTFRRSSATKKNSCGK